MPRTTVNVDDRFLAEAKRVLGTQGVTETVNAAMADVAHRAERAGFSVRDFDITDEDLADSRHDRSGADG